MLSLYLVYTLLRSRLGLLNFWEWPVCAACSCSLLFRRHPTLPSYCRSCADDRVRAIYRSVRLSQPKTSNSGGSSNV